MLQKHIILNESSSNLSLKDIKNEFTTFKKGYKMLLNDNKSFKKELNDTKNIIESLKQTLKSKINEITNIKSELESFKSHFMTQIRSKSMISTAATNGSTRDINNESNETNKTDESNLTINETKRDLISSNSTNINGGTPDIIPSELKIGTIIEVWDLKLKSYEKAEIVNIKEGKGITIQWVGCTSDWNEDIKRKDYAKRIKGYKSKRNGVRNIEIKNTEVWDPRLKKYKKAGVITVKKGTNFNVKWNGGSPKLFDIIDESKTDNNSRINNGIQLNTVLFKELYKYNFYRSKGWNNIKLSIDDNKCDDIYLNNNETCSNIILNKGKYIVKGQTFLLNGSCTQLQLKSLNNKIMINGNICFGESANVDGSGCTSIILDTPLNIHKKTEFILRIYCHNGRGRVPGIYGISNDVKNSNGFVYATSLCIQKIE